MTNTGNSEAISPVFTFVWGLTGVIAAPTLIFFITFVCFSLWHSRDLIRIGGESYPDDIGFEILYRYASTNFFKLHLATYMIATFVYFVWFLASNI